MGLLSGSGVLGVLSPFVGVGIIAVVFIGAATGAGCAACNGFGCIWRHPIVGAERYPGDAERGCCPTSGASHVELCCASAGAYCYDRTTSAFASRVVTIGAGMTGTGLGAVPGRVFEPRVVAGSNGNSATYDSGKNPTVPRTWPYSQLSGYTSIS
jgi:hypothetical protein